jgi:hypothetical protein
MVGSLGAVLDRLSGLLGKAFLLAGFLPAVLLLTICSLLTYHVWPAFRLWAQGVDEQSAVGLVPIWLGLVFVAGVLGFILWSINPWLREVLEGRHVRPQALRDFLVGQQLRERDRLDAELKALIPQLVPLRQAVRNLGYARQALKHAHVRGSRGDPSGLEDDLVRLHSKLSRRRHLRQRISFGDVKQLGGLLLTGLRANPAAKVRGLNRMQLDYEKLVLYARDRVEAEYSRLYSDKKFRFPEGAATLGPTSMGNMAELHRDYANNRYGMDIDVFWLRMQKLLKKDEQFFPILEEAKTQLDFAVAMTAILALATSFWSPVLLIWGTSLPIFLLVFGGGVPTTLLFYWIAVRSYRTFGEVLRSAVDLFRFSLLKSLHVSLPETSYEERTLWQGLTSLTAGETDQVIRYRHD